MLCSMYTLKRVPSTSRNTVRHQYLHDICLACVEQVITMSDLGKAKTLSYRQVDLKFFKDCGSKP